MLSAATFWWKIGKKLNFFKISKIDLDWFRKCQRVTRELFKESVIVFGWFYGTLEFWKNMDFDDDNTSSTIYTWDTWSRIFRKIYENNTGCTGYKRYRTYMRSRRYRRYRRSRNLMEERASPPIPAQSRNARCNIDLSSHIRFGIWGGDFIVGSPHILMKKSVKT